MKRANDLTRMMALRGAWAMMASAFTYPLDPDARKIIGDCALSLLLEIRGEKTLQYGQQQEWEIKFSPINEKNGTWWVAPPQKSH